MSTTLIIIIVFAILGVGLIGAIVYLVYNRNRSSSAEYVTPPGSPVSPDERNMLLSGTSSTVSAVQRSGKRFKVKKMVGEGAFGSVHQAIRVADRREVAIKIIGCKNEKETEEALAEYQLCCEVQGHRNVIRVHEVFLDKCDPKTRRLKKPSAEEARHGVKEMYFSSLGQIASLMVPDGISYLCIVSDFYEEGTLYQLLWEYRQQKMLDLKSYRKRLEDSPGKDLPPFIRGLAESMVWNFTEQLLSALVHLHDRNLVHRDLKPGNVLMCEKKTTLVLTDFGLSRMLDNGEYAQTQAGTLQYISPEQVARHYTNKSDVWGMACLIYNMCTLRITRSDGRVMFRDSNRPTFTEEIKTEMQGYSNELINFTLTLLNRDYKKRPSSTEALAKCKELRASLTSLL